MPYETEALYQALKPYLASSSESIMIHPWPKPDSQQLDQIARDKMHLVQDVVTAIRTLRSESVITPGLKIDCHLRQLDSKTQEILEDGVVHEFICSLARLNNLTSRTSISLPTEYLFTVFNGGEIYVPSKGVIDKEKEKARLLKNKGQLEQMLVRGKASLENKDFLARAPREEVESRRQTLQETQKKLEWLDRNLEGLS
jgi:valyl-tRNA synthetase